MADDGDVFTLKIELDDSDLQSKASEAGQQIKQGIESTKIDVDKLVDFSKLFDPQKTREGGAAWGTAFTTGVKASFGGGAGGAGSGSLADVLGPGGAGGAPGGGWREHGTGVGSHWGEGFALAVIPHVRRAIAPREEGGLGEHITKGFEGATKSVQVLNTAVEGLQRTLSQPSLARAVGAVGEVGEAGGMALSGLGGRAGSVGLGLFAGAELVKVMAQVGQAVSEFVPKAAEMTREIDNMAKATGTSGPKMIEFQKVLADHGIQADELARAFTRLNIRRQAAAADIARSVRDAPLETAEAQLGVERGRFGVFGAQQGVRAAALRLGFAPEEARLQREGDVQSVAGASLRLRQLLNPEASFNYEERQLQISEARTALRRARLTQEEHGAEEGAGLGPEGEAQQGLTKAMFELRQAFIDAQKARNQQADLPYRQVPAIAAQLAGGPGAGGPSLEQVSPAALQQAMFLRMQQQGGGIGGITKAFQELGQFGEQQQIAGLAATLGPIFALQHPELPGQLKTITPEEIQRLNIPATLEQQQDWQRQMGQTRGVETAGAQTSEAGATAMREAGLKGADAFVAAANTVRDKIGPVMEGIVGAGRAAADGLEAAGTAGHKAAEGLTAFFDKLNAWGGITANPQTGQAQQGPSATQQLFSGPEQAGAERTPSGQTSQPPFAQGGLIVGPGSGTSDSIPMALSNGEYVVNADSTARLGVPFLDAINDRRLARGGLLRLQEGGSGAKAGEEAQGGSGAMSRDETHGEEIRANAILARIAAQVEAQRSDVGGGGGGGGGGEGEGGGGHAQNVRQFLRTHPIWGGSWLGMMRNYQSSVNVRRNEDAQFWNSIYGGQSMEPGASGDPGNPGYARGGPVRLQGGGSATMFSELDLSDQDLGKDDAFRSPEEVLLTHMHWSRNTINGEWYTASGKRVPPGLYRQAYDAAAKIVDVARKRKGLVPGYAEGGRAPTIPALVSNGEYRFGADAVSHYGVGLFDAINFGMATGGLLKLQEGNVVDLGPPGLGEHDAPDPDRPGHFYRHLFPQEADAAAYAAAHPRVRQHTGMTEAEWAQTQPNQGTNLGRQYPPGHKMEWQVALERGRARGLISASGERTTWSDQDLSPWLVKSGPHRGEYRAQAQWTDLRRWTVDSGPNRGAYRIDEAGNLRPIPPSDLYPNLPQGPQEQRAGRRGGQEHFMTQLQDWIEQGGTRSGFMGGMGQQRERQGPRAASGDDYSEQVIDAYNWKHGLPSSATRQHRQHHRWDRPGGPMRDLQDLWGNFVTGGLVGPIRLQGGGHPATGMVAFSGTNAAPSSVAGSFGVYTGGTSVAPGEATGAGGVSGVTGPLALTQAASYAQMIDAAFSSGLRGADLYNASAAPYATSGSPAGPWGIGNALLYNPGLAMSIGSQAGLLNQPGLTPAARSAMIGEMGLSGTVLSQGATGIIANVANTFGPAAALSMIGGLSAQIDPTFAASIAQLGNPGGSYDLNLITEGGSFGAQVSASVLDAISASAIGTKLTSTGSKPSWYS